jgi:hypothetical protein
VWQEKGWEGPAREEGRESLKAEGEEMARVEADESKG